MHDHLLRSDSNSEQEGCVWQVHFVHPKWTIKGALEYHYLSIIMCLVLTLWARPGRLRCEHRGPTGTAWLWDHSTGPTRPMGHRWRRSLLSWSPTPWSADPSAPGSDGRGGKVQKREISDTFLCCSSSFCNATIFVRIIQANTSQGFLWDNTVPCEG